MDKYKIDEQLIKEGRFLSILGYTIEAMNREGFSGEVNEYHDSAISGDFRHLIMVSNEYLRMVNSGI